MNLWGNPQQYLSTNRFLRRFTNFFAHIKVIFNRLFKRRAQRRNIIGMKANNVLNTKQPANQNVVAVIEVNTGSVAAIKNLLISNEI
ncbi:MAG: hypothetical protein RIQ94_934 [Pseudomonadota bacterium]